MFTMDMPYVPVQAAPVVLAQATAAGSAAPADFILNECQETQPTPDNPRSAWRAVDPAGMLKNYIRYGRDGNPVNLADIKTTLLQGTKHGKITTEVDNTGLTFYGYDPEPGFLGTDKAVFLAEYAGKRYKINVEIKVLIVVDERQPQCDRPVMIKAPKPAKSETGNSADYNLASVSFSIADLPGGAVGQTSGSNITLDDNAAGNNWFIDTTLGDSSEFLPTSNPNEWVAKEGSAAYGKMDMLSVLLHEYGHALGIEHSADANDYMGTTLTAGVRRLPSADELALMQQLVSGVKDTLSPSPLPGGGEGQNGPSQLPLLPLGGFGLAFLGRLRSSRYGSLNIEADPNTLQVNYEAFANAQFLNGTFTSVNGMPPDNGWNKQGQVDIANGTATLQEVTTSQTRLNQVFMVKPTDRYLSFTLSGEVLSDPLPNPLPQAGEGANGAPSAAQPHDAFEVALLDANTGASLLGSDGLSRSDAFLNLQADGTESLASQVTKVVNADNSITYRVDLSALSNALKASGSAGQAVNLSFDLIGFGKANSHINVSDVRVSGLPELHDVTAAMNEDGTLAFDPFAQVDNAALLQLGSHVVDQPAHGTVTVNTDGTFVYTPAQDYFGSDTFTYRLNDGPLESNLATVSVSIAAVNDAPVAADVYATATEDTPLVINLGQAQGLAPTGYVTDVDSTTLTTQIVNGPTHGVLVANADGSYTYTPDANYNGLDSFTYKANDAAFAGDSLALDSNLATVTLTIGSVNNAPADLSNTVTTLEDTPYVFQLADFGYSDANDLVGAQATVLHQASGLQADGTSAIQWDNFIAVTIGSLPLAGNLTRNGVAVAAGLCISTADITAGLLVFAPTANDNGTTYASFTFQAMC